MNSALLHRSAEVQSDDPPDIKQDIEPSLRREVASDRPPPHVSDGGTTAVEVNSFIEDVSISSATEVARLITALQGVRDLLQSESQRVQGETGRYFHLNDGAFAAAKMMVKSIPQWRG